jgi:hypothetical protein
VGVQISPPAPIFTYSMAAYKSIACHLTSENSGKLESLIQNRPISARRGLLEKQAKEHGQKDEEYR